MARSSGRDSINQRISLTGDEEVRRQFEQLGRTGEKALQDIRRAVDGTEPRLGRMGGSSRQVGFALRNLSFQANDFFTSLASGAPVMQVFAQQGGQIVQAFQQGGGVGAVLSGAARGITSLITPMRLAGAAAITAAAGFAVLIGRAAEMEGSARQFAVIQKVLTALPQAVRGGDKLDFGRLLRNISPEELEAAAHRLRQFGLSYSEGIQKITEALRAGVPSGLAERIISIGQNIEAALGKGFGERFTKAIGEKDIEALRKLAAQLRIIGENSTVAQDGLGTLPTLVEAIERRVNGLHRESLGPFGKAIEDLRIGFDNFLTGLTKQIGVPALENLEAQLKSIQGIIKTLNTTPEELFNGISFGSLFTQLLAPPAAGTADPLFGIQDWVRQNIGEPFRIWVISEWPALLAQFRTTFLGELTTIRTQSEPIFSGLAQWIADTLSTSLSSGLIWEGFVSAARSAVESVRALLASLAEAAAATARAIAAAFSSANTPVATAAIPPLGVPDLSGSGGFARGGPIRGPGTGTSDSVPIWASTGEFVVNAFSTRRFLPLLQAINGFSMPSLVPRTRFATGGLVMAGARAGGGTPIYLQLPGGSTLGPMMSDRDVVNAVMRVARRAKMLSAGRKPSSAGGRRYGG